ncbi:MAG: UDP-N-acetylmuramoyl-L-alanyl-D-glutamate--2,6-diaminopimelate ligase [Chlamydiae bacterium]|nr:UDP-N-acetylmuramoyl-L-alanyl-D-glutamate--2,6-diaminopimelate ligase [Chlamydiota bacterium]
MERAMKIRELFKSHDVEVYGENLEILGISSNSKLIAKGDLFIAKNGSSFKGIDFAQEAVNLGAIALLLDKYEPAFEKYTQIVHKNPSKIEGSIADRFYRRPSKKLYTIAITGTNGKTSTSYLIRQLFGERKCGLIGTIEYLIGDKSVDASLTTPDVVSNHKMLSQMIENKMQVAVMEATSVALTQNRLDNIDFDIAVFTNLSQDHLDYHKDMQQYLESKALLFEHLSPDKTAIINIDDQKANQLVHNCRAQIKTYGTALGADYLISDIVLKASRCEFGLTIDGCKHIVNIPLIGMFNVYNATAAIATAVVAGIPIDQIIEKTERLLAPKGRLQSIENPYGAQIFVDFAHTEDALKNVIQSLKQIEHNRLITVFGCGGDRDPHKRASMGKTVSHESDITIITSDNPRFEDPEEICRQVKSGCDQQKEIYVEPDRKTAIENALNMLKAHDVLLIAGRGHEKFQIINGKKTPFEDATVVTKLIKNLSSALGK